MLFKKHVCLPCPLCLILLYFGISIFTVANSKKILLFEKLQHFYYIILYSFNIFYLQQEETAKHASLVNSCSL